MLKGNEMSSIEIVKQVRINMTAREWEIYASMEGSAEVAKQINSAIEQKFNMGCPREEVYAAAMEAMRANREFGTTDSEPMYVLEYVLKKLYK